MTTKGALREAGTQLVADGFDDALDLWDALYTYFWQRRPYRAGFFSLYPETTVSDVQQSAALLADQAAKLPADALGRKDTLWRWRKYRDAISVNARGKRATDAYPDNDGFWSESRRLAIDVSAASPLPTKGDIVLDAVKGTMTGKVEEAGVLDTISDYVDEAGDVVTSGAEKAADVAGDVLAKGGELAKGIAKESRAALKETVGGTLDAVVSPILDKLGTPLLIGAAIVGGVVLVPKLMEKKPSRRAA